MVVEHVQNQRVSLGCGTLILIALIVLFFSGRSDNLSREVQELTAEVRDLKRVVEAQTNQIKQFQQQLDRQAAPKAGKEK
jgi:archaellum component FlaC